MTRIFMLLLFSCIAFGCSVASQDVPGDINGSQEGADSDSGLSSEAIETDTTDSYIKKNLSWITQLGSSTNYGNDYFTGDNSDTDLCYAVVVDWEGSIYCAGYTGGNLGDDNAVNGDDNTTDVIIVKMNSSGELEWITQLGQYIGVNDPASDNSGQERCKGLALDSEGYLYCAGYTTGDLGKANEGGSDAFVMKLDSYDGSIMWISQLGNSEDQTCYGVAVDSEDNIYCVGDTDGDFGEDNGGVGKDIFFMKLDSEGSLQWIKQLGDETVGEGADGNDYCYSIAIDSSDNIYCGGSSYGSLGEDNAGENDIIMVKLDSEGELVWITQLGTDTKIIDNINHTGEDVCQSIAVDSKNNIFCAGYSTGPVGVGAISSEKSDGILLKFSSQGDLMWANQFGDNYDYDSTPIIGTRCAGVAVDSKDNVLCAGSTTGSFGEENGGGTSPLDAFIITFNNDGWPLDVFQLGATTKAFSEADHASMDFLQSLTIDSEDNIYATGYTYGSLGEEKAGLAESSDIFVMKLEQ